MRLRTLLFLLIILWIIPISIMVSIYRLNPHTFGNYENFLQALFTLFLAIVGIMQFITLFAQTKLIASPIIDATSHLNLDTFKIEMKIANVGNYVAYKPQLVVDVETKDRIFRYSCRIFPSLPPKSSYCSSEDSDPEKINPETIVIRPKFGWCNNKGGNF